MIFVLFWLSLFGLGFSEIDYNLCKLYERKLFIKETKLLSFSPRLDRRADRGIELFRFTGTASSWPGHSNLEIFFKLPRNLKPTLGNFYPDVIRAIVEEIRSFNAITQNEKNPWALDFCLIIKYVNPTVIDIETRQWHPEWSSFVTYIGMRHYDSDGDPKSVTYDHFEPLLIIGDSTIDNLQQKGLPLPLPLWEKINETFKKSCELWEQPINANTRQLLHYEPSDSSRSMSTISFPIIKNCSSKNFVGQLELQKCYDYYIGLPLFPIQHETYDNILLMGYYPITTVISYKFKPLLDLDGAKHSDGELLKFVICKDDGWSPPQDFTFQPAVETI